MTNNLENTLDPRIEKAMLLIRKLTSESAQDMADVEEIFQGLKAIDEEFKTVEENKERINRLMELLLSYTVMDFSEKAPLSERGDELDALAAGLNSLIEEIQYSSNIVEEKNKQLNEAQRLTHIGSWEWNVPSNTIEWSDELYRIYGLKPQEFEASYENYIKYIHPDDRDYVNGIVQKAYTDHQPFIFLHRIIRGDGEVRSLDCTGFVTLDSKGAIFKMTGTAQDITDRKVIEEEKDKAEKEKQMAIEALRFKQQFLSNMSHEIRTPLTAIIGFTKVVLKSELDEKQKEYINAIKVSGDALLVLVNDILDLAKVNAGKMSFDETPFHLRLSINNMLLLFETKTQQKNITIVNRYDENIPQTLIGDPTRLNQIILNLVSNAVKFTSKGEITVDTSLINEDDENVQIAFSITDTGIGIEEGNLEKIFDTFQQASSETSRIFGGTGLGLAIVKQLVEAQGGTIEVESTLGVGSKFRFVLNFKKGDPIPEQDAPCDDAEVIHSEEINVLVVEDVALNQLLMKVVLTNLGFKPTMADNGKIAIEKLKENNYDIILMDLHMPEMDGFTATDIIRNEMKLQIPIIALTADVTSADITRSKELGMNDYATKPIDQKKLYDKIIHILKLNSTQN